MGNLGNMCPNKKYILYTVPSLSSKFLSSIFLSADEDGQIIFVIIW